MNPLYFRITEKPDPEVFDPRWVEVLDGRRLVLDRAVWRRSDVSRTPSGCVVLRADQEFGTWELKNQASGRRVVLGDASRRYELMTGMSMALGHGTWKGRLTEAFRFEITSAPPGDRVRSLDSLDDGAGPDGDVLPTEHTTPGELAPRAAGYLAKHSVKRFALAYMWREHLMHTSDLAEDIPSATVGRAFRVTHSTVTGWREDLALHVFAERGHQHAVRDVVLRAELMSLEDVARADRYVRDLHRSRS